MPGSVPVGQRCLATTRTNIAALNRGSGPRYMPTQWQGVATRCADARPLVCLLSRGAAVFRVSMSLSRNPPEDDMPTQDSAEERIVRRLGPWLYPDIDSRPSWACAHGGGSVHLECVSADSFDKVCAYYRDVCVQQQPWSPDPMAATSHYSLDYSPRWLHRVGPPLVVVHATAARTVTVTGVRRGDATVMYVTMVECT